MTDLTIDATKVKPVEIIEQYTTGIAETLAAGQAVRIDTSSGKATKANGTTAAEARMSGVVISTDNPAAVTIVRKGLLEVGDALDALTYDDDVYLSDTDGVLADAAGTVTKLAGTVVPATGQSTYKKLLRLDL